MAETVVSQDKPAGKLKRWLLEGHAKQTEGAHAKEGQHHQHPWWKVVCLTGVDYFSTLGYQPGIAALAAGALAPLATLILVLLTLFGALPIYHRVAAESPHGESSIALLERLLSRWLGKLFVLCLLGFAATDFIITITLSAADATAHIVENPFAPHFLHGQQVAVTLVLIALLSAVFLKGFKEAIGIAVVLVAIYLALNAVVVSVSLYQVVTHPSVLSDWRSALFARHGNPFVMFGLSLLLFPKLALGLSGFETGVAVMPLVKGDPSDTPEDLTGRIRNTRKLLTTAALIMSVFLIASSFATTVLISPEAFRSATPTLPAGEANGRALAYLAHRYLGPAFGTVYDLSTIAILWFAGASAMAALLNIMPRYLPRYGMAPDWARAVRPLVLVFTAIAFVVTIVFKADVNAQGGAYATGVLVLITSASVAAALSARRENQRGALIGFSLITLVFLYTTVVNIIERPEGLRIASLFIGGIIVISLISRVYRTTELRVERVELDAEARRFIEEISARGEIRLIANKRQNGDEKEYRLKEREQRADNHIPPGDRIVFLEVEVDDASDFTDVLEVKGVRIEGARMVSQVRGETPYTYYVLRARGSAVPNGIAALLLHLRDTTGKLPHLYFSWSEGNPLQFLMRYVLFGEGDTAPVTREVLRKAEPDPERRPALHVGG